MLFSAWNQQKKYFDHYFRQLDNSLGTIIIVLSVITLEAYNLARFTTFFLKLDKSTDGG